MSGKYLLGALGLFALAAACGGGSNGGGAQQLAFGACSDSATDCASGVLDTGHRACSTTCTGATDCPPEPKSGTPKCKNGVCSSERSDVDCEHLGEGGASNTAGGGAGRDNSSSSGAPASAGASATGGGGRSSGGASATAGSGGKAGGTIGIADPCSNDAECESGICYRPGGPPGFCTTSCTTSFDAKCSGSGPGGQNAQQEYVYCMPFADGGRCYPGCVHATTLCSKYAGTVCAKSVKDIKNYNGNVCLEAL